ncbi:hypothetical protein D3C85_1713370 [compost metagenome]
MLWPWRCRAIAAITPITPMAMLARLRLKTPDTISRNATMNSGTAIRCNTRLVGC